MVLKTNMVKEPKNELITDFLVGHGRTDIVINNLIKNFKII